MITTRKSKEKKEKKRGNPGTLQSNAVVKLKKGEKELAVAEGNIKVRANPFLEGLKGKKRDAVLEIEGKLAPESRKERNDAKPEFLKSRPCERTKMGKEKGGPPCRAKGGEDFIAPYF